VMHRGLEENTGLFGHDMLLGVVNVGGGEG